MGDNDSERGVEESAAPVESAEPATDSESADSSGAHGDE